jgi:hypothetical protein
MLSGIFRAGGWTMLGTLTLAAGGSVFVIMELGLRLV